MDRKEKILRKALDLFNEKGIEEVGVRDVAKSMGISPGNLSYHFPKKIDLIVALYQQLIQLNAPLQQTLDANELELHKFLESFKHLQINQWQFRCLYISLPALLRQYSEELAFYRGADNERKAHLKGNLKSLISSGDIRRMHPFELEMLTIKISFLYHFWISESEISLAEMSELEKRTKNLRLLSAILEKYTTKQGYQSLMEYVRELG